MAEAVNLTGSLLEATRLTALLEAARRASRGHRDNPEVAAFLMDAERNALRLQRALRLPPEHPDAWAPGPTHTFRLYDPKPRLITVSPFSDRVVHHALIGAVEPRLERYAITDSYACRRGRGQHAAVRRAQRFACAAPWVLKVDISAYFASVSHHHLLAILARRIGDGPLLERFARIVHAGGASGRGLPVGSLSSQHLANLYLGRLDHWLKDDLGERRYLRYMDDCLLFGQRGHLRALLPRIAAFLDAELGLQINRRVSGLFPVHNGVPFLGWRIYPRLLRPRPATWRRARRQLCAFEKRLRAGAMSEEEVARRANSLYAHLSFGDTHRLRCRFLQQRSGADLSRLQPGQTGRLLEQQPAQRPGRQSQQEHPVQREPQPRPPAGQHDALVQGHPELRPDRVGLRTGSLRQSVDPICVLRRSEKS